MESGRMLALTGKLTKKLVENLGSGRHGDGGGLYLVVDPSGARRWIVRVTVRRSTSPKRSSRNCGRLGRVTFRQIDAYQRHRIKKLKKE
jgi:hypothetical protein